MEHSTVTKPHIEYIREVRSLLPKEAFDADPGKLAWLAGYFVILITGYFLFRLSNNLFFYCLLTCLLTHCLSCIGFLAHELSHNAIVKYKRSRYFLELVSWGINLIPTTVWDRVHNHTHHAQINTVNDPDRLYMQCEKSAATKLYTKIFYANKDFLKWNPMVLLHFIPYIFRNIVAAFYPRNSKPVIVPYKPKYDRRQKLRIIGELGIIVLMQVAIFYAAGKSWTAFIFASPLSYVFTSAVFNTYIFTNHFLNPIADHSDPVLSTTTVEVPAILNRIHFNFAYHTEHHLFPSMNSDFYPRLSSILRNKYPDRYNYLTLKHAWKQLWKNDDFVSATVKREIIQATIIDETNTSI